MALIGNDADTLLHGLSAFWHRFFRDIKDLQTTYEGTEILFGQVYLNFLSDVLNTSVVEAPLFRKEFYKLITVREDQLVFREHGDTVGTPPVPTFFGNPGTDRYVYTSPTVFFNAMPQLQDTIYAPKTSLIEGEDYRVAGAEVQFKNDPTSPLLPGYAHRRVTIAIGGKFTSASVNWISAGVQKGDALYFSEATNIGAGIPATALTKARKATIIHVTGTHLTVSIDTPLPTFPQGIIISGFSWRIVRTRDDGSLSPNLPLFPPLPNIGIGAPFTDGQIAMIDGVGISTLEVSELSFWAVDVRIDDLTLYNTYGYFFTNKELSSETYRSLLRGLLQLYILGPALARLESALNLTAGLPTIREEDEILVSYDSGILSSGATGVLLSGDLFQVPTSIFSKSSEGGYIKITASNDSENIGTFNIVEFINGTTVRLTPVLPFVPGINLEWLYTKDNAQTVTTSRNIYQYPLATPMRPDVKDPANYNILTFRAFESITTAIQVTDYIQDPEWWHSITIPPELLPGLTGPQRASTSQLYPNILGPAGNANIGDPGFYLGRDEDSGNLQQGSTGSLSVLNEFDTPYNTFTLESVGEYVEIYSALNPTNVGVWQIASYVSPTRVVLTGPPGLLEYKSAVWGYFTGHLATNPYRHNAAFILLDRFLKLHLFAVFVDPSVQLTGLLINDLKKILADVKPVHTALYFQPQTIFKDVIHLNEAFDFRLIVRKIEEMFAINNDLIIGSPWIIGDAWQYTNPTGGAITIGVGAGFIPAAIGGTDPSIQPADPTNIPPGSPPDLRWIDRPLYAYMHL